MIIIEIFERGCAQQYSPDQPPGPRFAHDSLLEEGRSDRRSQFRIRLTAGGSRIRTSGPSPGFVSLALT
jgi:hypothetical protein